jgi:hypothetical protein
MPFGSDLLDGTGPAGLAAGKAFPVGAAAARDTFIVLRRNGESLGKKVLRSAFTWDSISAAVGLREPSKG